MPIDDNLKELENLILSQSEYIEKDVPNELVKLVGDIQQELIAGGRGGKKNEPFKNRTGNLRRSIFTALEGSSLTIKMLNYGYYLAFGVNGKNRSNALGLPNEVATAFGVTEGYQFGSQNVYGIDPFKFYPQDIENKILEILSKDGGTT